jgi:hypothetical protein
MISMTRMMIATALLGGTLMTAGVQANPPSPPPKPPKAADQWEARRSERSERPRPERPERSGEDNASPAPLMRALARLQAEVARIAMQEEELRGRAAQANREDLPAERRERLARMQALRTELLELEKKEMMEEVRERLADIRTRLENAERRELPAVAFLAERLTELEKAATDFDSFRLALRQMRQGAANEGWIMPSGPMGHGIMGEEGAPGQRGPRAGGPPDAPRAPQPSAGNPEIRAQRLNREIEALEQRIKRLSEELAIMGSEVRREME